MPKISVIMPVYNSGQFLEESIESILNQTFDNFEFIIIYDNSTDNSLEIIKKYMALDKRIILIENKIKSGIAAARNKGLDISRGQYIALIDSDDISLPTRLEKQYLFLENNSNYFLIGSNGIRVDENGNYLETVKFGEDPTLNARPCLILNSSVMFRNSDVRYREKFIFAEDCDFYLILLTRGLKLRNIDEILIKVRMRVSSTTLDTRTRVELFHQKAVEFYKQRLEKGFDNYDNFDGKEIMSIPKDDSRSIYLKSLIGFSLKNGNIEEAKKYFNEYSENISFNNRIKYKIVFVFPFLYSLRWKIKKLRKNYI